MVAQPEERLVDVHEYLAYEATSTVKHEYTHGRVYALGGGTIDHAPSPTTSLSLTCPIAAFYRRTKL